MGKTYGRVVKLWMSYEAATMGRDYLKAERDTIDAPHLYHHTTER
jgi:hypothetical protein